jgi:hypothetical protein
MRRPLSAHVARAALACLCGVLALAAPEPAHGDPAGPAASAAPASRDAGTSPPASGAAAAARSGARAAVVGESSRDLGVVAPGERAVAEFRIENRGKARLELEPKPIVPPVPQANVALERRSVAPGKSAKVTVTLDTERLSGPGSFRVPIATNDPEAKEIALSVSVEVKPFLLADPGYARFISVQKEREGTIGQTIWSTDGATFRVVRVESPMPALRVAFRDAGAGERRAAVAGSQWRVDATLASDAPVGALSGEIVVTTDHPRQKRLRLPLSGFMRPMFAVTPPEIDLGRMEADSERRFGLHVVNFASEEIAIDRGDSDVTGVAVDVSPKTPGRLYSARVTVGPKLVPGKLDGKVRLYTGSPKAPVIEIPIRGVIVGGEEAKDR